MDPTLWMALMGGTSLASGLFGAQAQNDAMMYNYNANIYNIQEQARARAEAMRWAREQDRDNKLGMTDGTGNRTHFVDGVGWVTDLSQTGREINTAQNQEAMNVLGTDLPRKRRIEGENEHVQYQDRSDADALRRQFRDTMRTSPSTTEAQTMFRAAANRGINETMDAATTAAMRQNLRGGASNSGDLLSAFNRQRTKASAEANMDADMRGMDYAASKRFSDAGNLSQLYNMFASRAAGTNNVSYQPQDFSGKGSATALAQGDAANNKNEMDAVTMAPGTLDYMQPNMGTANAIGQVGNGIAGAMAAQQGGAQAAQMREMWMRMMQQSQYGNRLQY